MMVSGRSIARLRFKDGAIGLAPGMTCAPMRRRATACPDLYMTEDNLLVDNWEYLVKQPGERLGWAVWRGGGVCYHPRTGHSVHCHRTKFGEYLDVIIEVYVGSVQGRGN